MSPFEAQKSMATSMIGPIDIFLKDGIQRDHGGPESIWVFRTDRLQAVDWDFCGGREVTVYTAMQCDKTADESLWQIDAVFLLRDRLLKAKVERLSILDADCKTVETWFHGRLVEQQTDEGLVVEWKEGHKHVVRDV